MGVGCNETGNVSTVKHFWHVYVTTVTTVTFSKQNINGHNSSNNNCSCIVTNETMIMSVVKVVITVCGSSHKVPVIFV